MTTFVRLLLIGGTLARLTSAQSTAPKPSVPPFSITIAAVDSEAKAGSEVFIKITVKNTSQEEAPGRGGFYAEGLNTAFHYDCRNSAAKFVNKEINTVFGSAGDAPALKPGESYEQTAPISRACDLSHPGQYEIQVSRNIPNDPQHRVVKSNTIKITVKPAQQPLPATKE
jgi:hypothetical protein